MLHRTWLMAVICGTGVVLLIFRHPLISELFHQHIPHRPQRHLFLAAISFVLTFGVTRSLAYANYPHLGPFHDIYIRGRHIHHLVWGMLLLLAVGYGWLVETGTGSVSSSVLASRTLALLYGAGAALTLDEFALWLNLEDVYWSQEGRASTDAVLMYLGGFIRALGHEVLRSLASHPLFCKPNHSCDLGHSVRQ